MHIDDALPSAEAELFRRVDEVAHYIWDPIGLCGHPEARDEYSGYLLGLYGRAKAKDEDGLIEFMKQIQIESMGMLFDRERTERAATAIMKWANLLEPVDDEPT